jgi:hypothetical protein
MANFYLSNQLILCWNRLNLQRPFFSQGTREEWLVVFDIASLIFVFGCLTYSLCGSSDLQWWAKEKVQPNENTDDLKGEGETLNIQEK